jgi:hypothetical protein
MIRPMVLGCCDLHCAHLLSSFFHSIDTANALPELINAEGIYNCANRRLQVPALSIRTDCAEELWRVFAPVARFPRERGRSMPNLFCFPCNYEMARALRF